ncbi:MAG TPA: nickel pincer cofactor biosynthesis protein LarB [Cyclobacteriaceae bacterium]|nr:nickel pincer cofactor biosynthesis protein LarB [Cyclobacteriaceae bacterium]
MQKDNLRALLNSVQNQELSIEDALARLENLPFEDLGYANLDHHRSLRKGFPEVVFCQNKTTEQVKNIIGRLAEHDNVLATRANQEMFEAVKKILPHAQYNELGRTITVVQEESKKKIDQSKLILVISAGTSDIPVAEEAIETAMFMGNYVKSLYDVGVAGIHRLLNNKAKIDEANVLIVVAGMDGALPSVVGGLVAKPLIAVPTSVGYGASYLGVGPLLTMLNSCSPGVAVVNIDNGFGAGYFASLINK